MSVSIVLAVHEQKTINGSNFYCYEYFSFLKKLNIDCSFIIHIDNEYQKELILDSFKRYNDLNLIKKSIFFLYKRTEIFFYLKNKTSVVFLDIYSFQKLSNFTSNNSKLFIYSNRYSIDEYKKLSNNIKNKSLFYGFYDDQFHHIKERLCINFNCFSKIDKKQEKKYIHLLNPNIENTDFYIKNVMLYTHDYNIDNYSIKRPNSNIKFLFNNISEIFYYINDDIIDKNNRMLLESQFFNIKYTIIGDCDTINKVKNKERLLSRNYYDFELKKDNKLIRDIIENEQNS